MTYSDDHMMAALKMPSSSNARRLYKLAWVAALLGFVLRIFDFVLSLYWYARQTEYIRGDHDIDYIRDYSWLSGIMGIASFIGTVLMVASIVFVIRGLLIDNNRQRSGAILVGTLKKLELVAIIALTLCLLYLPVTFLIWFVSWYSYVVIYMTNAAFVFVAALPLIVAHALYKSST